MSEKSKNVRNFWIWRLTFTPLGPKISKNSWRHLFTTPNGFLKIVSRKDKEEWTEINEELKGVAAIREAKQKEVQKLEKKFKKADKALTRQKEKETEGKPQTLAEMTNTLDATYSKNSLSNFFWI